MKKLIVLLLAFAMVGAAFAQTPTLSASSTLKFGVDLDTMASGFANVNSLTFKVPFAFTGATSKKADSGWRGEISVANLYFVLSDNQLANGGALTFADYNDKDGDGVPDSGEYATLSAKITNGTWTMSVSTKNGMDYNKAADLATGDVALAIDADGAGTTITYAANGLSFGVTAASKSDWTTNTANEYALSTDLAYTVSKALTLSAGLAYDVSDAADKELGAYAKAVASVGGASVTLASDMDFTAGFVADARLDVGYALMDGLDLALIGYYSMSDSDVEAEVTLDYAVDAVEAGVWFDALDVISAAAYELGVYAGYTFTVNPATSLYVYAEYVNDFAGAQSLTPYAKLTNTSVANTTITLEYNAGDADVLAGNFGTLVAAAKISL